MLKLRRAAVLEARAPERAHSGEQRLLVALADARGAQPREAIADLATVGAAQAGDEVIVNVQALDLGLGSGGFDIVLANLTRGLDGPGAVPGEPAAAGARAMKLNYTSIQHEVEVVDDERLALPLSRPVAVLALHGQLAPAAWALASAAPGRTVGYVQTEGGALPGSRSRVVRQLRSSGLLAGHVTAGAAFGGESEALTVAGAIHHGLSTLGWDAAVVGPGPGVAGSGTALGHGGMAALDSAHVALALGCPTLLVARMSSSDARSRHRGISHHTLTVLDLLLAPVTVALPAGMRTPVGMELRASLGGVFPASNGNRRRPDSEPGRPARIARHDWRRSPVDLPGYARSGLPADTMGRTLAQDPLFFAAALAGGGALAELVTEGTPHVAVEEPL